MSGNQINYLYANSGDGEPSLNNLANFEVENMESGDLGKGEIIATVIGSIGLIGVVATVIGVYYGRKPVIREREPTGFFLRLFARLWLWIARVKGRGRLPAVTVA